MAKHLCCKSENLHLRWSTPPVTQQILHFPNSPSKPSTQRVIQNNNDKMHWFPPNWLFPLLLPTLHWASCLFSPQLYAPQRSLTHMVHNACLYFVLMLKCNWMYFTSTKAKMHHMLFVYFPFWLVLPLHQISCLPSLSQADHMQRSYVHIVWGSSSCSPTSTQSASSCLPIFPFWWRFLYAEHCISSLCRAHTIYKL